MNALFSKGLVLEQFKEPALSRDLREFIRAGAAEPLPRVPKGDPASLTGEEICEIADLAQIVDERDGTPLVKKLTEARRRGVGLVVADAIDDEPYVSSQLNPLFKLAQQAVGGLLLASRAVGTDQVQIAVYKNLFEVQMHIPHTLYGVKIKRITGKYPAESRAKLTDEGKGVLLVGACALIHLHRAVHKNLKQTTCFVTVAGNCVANPTNLEVAVGTTALQVLERCGLADDPTHIVAGGPMTGESICDPENAPIAPTTRAILAFKSDVRDRHYHCIGCGKCAGVCPQNLSPAHLYKAAATKHVQLLRLFDVQSCVGCGTCSYICPAKLELSVEIRKAARLLAAIDDSSVRLRTEVRP